MAAVGYVRVNAALLAKMKIRIEQRGNAEADYVSVAPESCPPGTELSAVPYVNQFGTNKVWLQLAKTCELDFEHALVITVI